ncbi:MAG TPA: helix-turn-helix domain-containing protein [Candidatus Limiplasma sp.]|nr:helix-turn-helix domain-containing protein [Candidatus Limiplasma sp.]HPS80436.1 helix-turn-helix domain-containing protein [Candidatus Limiplasma sp.]
MEWVDRMNRVMDDLEGRLTGEVDPDAISRIMTCPYSVFQRSFGPVTGVSLSEYLRRRRLSRAAYELQNTDQRILDIAVRYGYDSADAFAAAFKRLHGITPQEARRADAVVKYYPRLTFTLMIAGVEEMEYKVVEKEAFQVLGIRRTTPQGGGTWAIAKAEGVMEKVRAICQHDCDLGLCFGFDAQGNNDYFCGAEYGGQDFDGMDRYACPKATWLIFTAQGSIGGRTLANAWRRIYGEFMPQSAYRQLDLPTVEQYRLWDEANDRCAVDIWIPVQAQQGR